MTQTQSIHDLPISSTARVQRAKEAFLNAIPEMCCQRALIYTDVYQNASADCPKADLAPP